MNDIILKERNGTDGFFINYQTKDGICISRITNSKPGDIQFDFENSLSEFDSLIDENNNLHLIFQDKSKNVIYKIYTGDEWKEANILKAKNCKSPAFKGFKLIKVNSILSTFYTIEHGNELLLCHQFIHSEGPAPEVIGMVSEKSSYFYTFLDISNNIYIFYIDFSAQLLGYRKYIWSEKRWDEFSPINDKKNEIINFSVYIDTNDIIHICYNTLSGLYYLSADIEYENVILGQKLLLTKQLNESSLPVILKINEELWITWINSNRLWGTVSTNNGSNWSKVRNLISKHNSAIQKLSIHSAHENNLYCYGIINNKISIPLMPALFAEPVKTLEEAKQSGIYIKNAGQDVEQFAGKFIPAENSLANLSRDDIEMEKARLTKELIKNSESKGDSEYIKKESKDNGIAIQIEKNKNSIESEINQTLNRIKDTIDKISVTKSHKRISRTYKPKRKKAILVKANTKT